ncbi:30S ribosomal protein S6 [bacterium]|nr:MAG: 30S ribosomal protein S6 [bacterium]QQR62222.1 MAG: 30S ribosomal protein S6 [bacterium]QQR63216.1 MAG: 30S ribosomal protein S6 [bacterium]
MENIVRYEVLILAGPEITQDESKELEKQIENVVQLKKGTMISFERWGKYRLAYPVRKNEYGVYFLGRFQTVKDAALLKELDMLLSVKFETVIMRSMISLLDKSVSLEYQRPRSLEEAPVGLEMATKDRRNNSYDMNPELDNGQEGDDLGNE